ncbi:hypothetical protein D3C80_1136920 [compost metagenome]
MAAGDPVPELGRGLADRHARAETEGEVREVLRVEFFILQKRVVEGIDAGETAYAVPGPFFDKRRGIAWIHHQHRFATFGQGEEQIAQAENVVERHREQQHVIRLGPA